MAIDADKQILNQITSFVYLRLFGMTRLQMLIECKKHTPTGWHNLWGDEDENMHDQLSIGALNCLSAAEEAIASYIKRKGIHVVTGETLVDLYFLLDPYRVDDLVIWNDDAIDWGKDEC